MNLRESAVNPASSHGQGNSSDQSQGGKASVRKETDDAHFGARRELTIIHESNQEGVQTQQTGSFGTELEKPFARPPPRKSSREKKQKTACEIG